jgi:hypothetical protein
MTGILPLCDVVQRRLGSVKKIRKQLQGQKLLLSKLIGVLLFVMQRVSSLQLVFPSVGQPSVGSEIPPEKDVQRRPWCRHRRNQGDGRRSHARL